MQAAKSFHIPWISECLEVLTDLDNSTAWHCLLGTNISALLILYKAQDSDNRTFVTLTQLRVSEGLINANEASAVIRRYRGLLADLANTSSTKVEDHRRPRAPPVRRPAKANSAGRRQS